MIRALPSVLIRIAVLTGVLLCGCSGDECRTLCNTLAAELGTCLSARGLGWEALGAQKEDDWAATCLDDWESVRADLEGREVSASQDQCADAATELDSPECDGLLALYGL